MAIIAFWMLLFLYAASAQPVIYINNDGGGKVHRYDSYMRAYRAQRAELRFSGQCSSACTLYLHLPPEQVCVLPGAYFQFHSSRNGTPDEIMLVNRYMWRGYPQWVKDWLGPLGLGAREHIITMPYEYIRRYMRPCYEK
jgi:hypothetical protein